MRFLFSALYQFGVMDRRGGAMGGCVDAFPEYDCTDMENATHYRPSTGWMVMDRVLRAGRIIFAERSNKTRVPWRGESERERLTV